MATPEQTNCPHCNRPTDVGELCGHCGGYLCMAAVLVADSCRTSIADGSTIGLEGVPVVLLMFDGHVDSSSTTPTHVTVAVRSDDVPGLRESLWDRLLTVGVQGSDTHHHDRTQTSSDRG